MARIAYWISLFWTGVAVLGLTVAPAVRLSVGGRLPVSFVAAVATLAACAPLAALVAVIADAAWPRHMTPLSPLDWYAQTLFVSAPLVAAVLWYETRGRARRAPPATPDAPGDEPPGRLSPRQRAEALCLQMEDHYVRVHTPGRSELVLMPMRQAVAELEPLGGLRVHRSWWVARAAVVRAEPEGRSLHLLLSNGLRVPVARNRVADLRAAGWLNDLRGAVDGAE